MSILIEHKKKMQKKYVTKNNQVNQVNFKKCGNAMC